MRYVRSQRTGDRPHGEEEQAVRRDGRSQGHGDGCAASGGGAGADGGEAVAERGEQDQAVVGPHIAGGGGTGLLRGERGGLRAGTGDAALGLRVRDRGAVVVELPRVGGHL